MFCAQMGVGIGWNDIMQASIKSIDELYVAIYFLAFLIIFRILFTNVFIGMVCDAFSVSFMLFDNSVQWKLGERSHVFVLQNQTTDADVVALNVELSAEFSTIRRVLTPYLSRKLKSIR